MNDFADLHTHTIASGHAYNTLCEMVRAAAQIKLPLLGISDHAPDMPGSCSDMYFGGFGSVPRELEGVRLLLGSELNIINYEGDIDLPEKRLKRLDYAIASLHIQCLAYGSKEQNTAAVLAAIENPYVNIIGHPDDGRFPLDYKAVVKAAGEHHKLIEINSSSLAPDSTRVNSRENYLEILGLCKTYGVSVIMGSDAHFMTDIANHKDAMNVIQEAGFPEELVVNTSLDLLAPYIPALKN